jgi:hypothetical protein
MRPRIKRKAPESLSRENERYPIEKLPILISSKRKSSERAIMAKEIIALAMYELLLLIIAMIGGMKSNINIIARIMNNRPSHV